MTCVSRDALAVALSEKPGAFFSDERAARTRVPIVQMKKVFGFKYWQLRLPIYYADGNCDEWPLNFEVGSVNDQNLVSVHNAFDHITMSLAACGVMQAEFTRGPVK